MFGAALVATAASLSATQAQAVTQAAIVVDAKTGKVLYAKNADTRAFPASLTKIMTLYLAFEALEAGRITLDTRIRVSAKAAAEPPSKLGVKAGNTITVKDAMLSLVTRSANDMATALGEHLGGSEANFANMMTRRARSLGMNSTTFRNAHGLPNSAQITTARDMAILGRAIQDRFPTYFRYFKTTSFTYAGSKIGNHNRLLGRVQGVDGIKTGYTRASGFNLVTSVNLPDRRIVAVVLGGSSGASRDAQMEKMVGQYIGKASRGPRTAPLILPRGGDMDFQVPSGDLVASAASGDRAQQVAVLAVPPQPRLRPATAVSAYAAEEAAPIAPAAAAVTDIATLIPEEYRAQGDISDDPEPLAETLPPPTPIAAADAVGMERFADMPTMSGWKIQIAAAPTQSSALAILQKARAAAVADVFADAAPYTEPVEKGSDTLYRARFAGFAGKEQAQAACEFLVRQKFACYAIAD